MLLNPADMKLQNYFAVSLEVGVDVELSVWLHTLQQKLYSLVLDHLESSKRPMLS
jgi:hypothetical protein